MGLLAMSAQRPPTTIPAALSNRARHSPELTGRFQIGTTRFISANDELARRKRLLPMRRHNFNPNRRFADVHAPDAMHQPDRFQRPPFPGLFKKQMKLVLGHLLERLIVDGRDRAAFLYSANRSQKINGRSHARRNDALLQQRVFVDFFAGNGQLGPHGLRRSPALNRVETRKLRRLPGEHNRPLDNRRPRPSGRICAWPPVLGSARKQSRAIPPA